LPISDFSFRLQVNDQSTIGNRHSEMF